MKTQNKQIIQPKLKLMINSLSFFDDTATNVTTKKNTKPVPNAATESIANWENDGGSNLTQLSPDTVKKLDKKLSRKIISFKIKKMAIPFFRTNKVFAFFGNLLHSLHESSTRNFIKRHHH